MIVRSEFFDKSVVYEFAPGKWKAKYPDGHVLTHWDDMAARDVESTFASRREAERALADAGFGPSANKATVPDAGTPPDLRPGASM